MPSPADSSRCPFTPSNPFQPLLLLCLPPTRLLPLWRCATVCYGGDLEDFGVDGKAATLTEAQLRFVGVEVVCVIAYLHAHKVMFRDLKPANLLLDEGGHVRLIDFGIAKQGKLLESPEKSAEMGESDTRPGRERRRSSASIDPSPATTSRAAATSRGRRESPSLLDQRRRSEGCGGPARGPVVERGVRHARLHGS